MKPFRRFKGQIDLTKGIQTQAQLGHLYALLARTLDVVNCSQSEDPEKSCVCSPEMLEEMAGEIYLALVGHPSTQGSTSQKKTGPFAICSVCDGIRIYFSGMLHKRRGQEEMWDSNPYEAEVFRSLEDATFALKNMRGHGQDTAMKICRHPARKQRRQDG